MRVVLPPLVRNSLAGWRDNNSECLLLVLLGQCIIQSIERKARYARTTPSSLYTIIRWSSRPDDHFADTCPARYNSKSSSSTRSCSRAQPFVQRKRPGSVDVETEYDTSSLLIPLDEIHTLLKRDDIPALTDPELVDVADADWLDDKDRIIDVTIKGDLGTESVAVPIKLLNFHEVANMTIAGVPVAATYCPLCDSVTLVKRTVLVKPADPLQDAYEEVLEFGVSGALYNSNVLMYDRQHIGLWSQLGLKAVSGPMSGTQLDLLPVKLIPWSAYKEAHPTGKVVSINTGHDRPYDGNPYQSYFEKEDYIMVPVKSFGDTLPKKTLGVGIRANGQSFFVPITSIEDRFIIDTKLGQVVVAATDAGVQVIVAPPSVQTVQSFYYSFSAFHPDTVVVTESAQ